MEFQVIGTNVIPVESKREKRRRLRVEKQYVDPWVLKSERAARAHRRAQFEREQWLASEAK